MLWSQVRFLGNNKLVKQSYIWIFLVPMLGKILQSAKGNIYIFENTLILELPFSWSSLYFSALAFAIANLLYLIGCPSIIKNNENYSDFKASGYNFHHLNIYINALSDEHFNEDSIVKTKIEEYSKNTVPDDIDIGNSTVISFSKIDKLYNIKNSFENNVFWDLYEASDTSHSTMLYFSSLFFFFGFVLLAKILVQNLFFVMSIIT